MRSLPVTHLRLEIAISTIIIKTLLRKLRSGLTELPDQNIPIPLPDAAMTGLK